MRGGVVCAWCRVCEHGVVCVSMCRVCEHVSCV